MAKQNNNRGPLIVATLACVSAVILGGVLYVSAISPAANTAAPQQSLAPQASKERELGQGFIAAFQGYHPGTKIEAQIVGWDKDVVDSTLEIKSASAEVSNSQEINDPQRYEFKMSDQAGRKMDVSLIQMQKKGDFKIQGRGLTPFTRVVLETERGLVETRTDWAGAFEEAGLRPRIDPAQGPVIKMAFYNTLGRGAVWNDETAIKGWNALPVTSACPNTKGSLLGGCNITPPTTSIIPTGNIIDQQMILSTLNSQVVPTSQITQLVNAGALNVQDVTSLVSSGALNVQGVENLFNAGVINTSNITSMVNGNLMSTMGIANLMNVGAINTSMLNGFLNTGALSPTMLTNVINSANLNATGIQSLVSTGVLGATNITGIVGSGLLGTQGIANLINGNMLSPAMLTNMINVGGLNVQGITAMVSGGALNVQGLTNLMNVGAIDTSMITGMISGGMVSPQGIANILNLGALNPSTLTNLVNIGAIDTQILAGVINGGILAPSAITGLISGGVLNPSTLTGLLNSGLLSSTGLTSILNSGTAGLSAVTNLINGGLLSATTVTNLVSGVISTQVLNGIMSGLNVGSLTSLLNGGQLTQQMLDQLMGAGLLNNILSNNLISGLLGSGLTDLAAINDLLDLAGLNNIMGSYTALAGLVFGLGNFSTPYGPANHPNIVANYVNAAQHMSQQAAATAMLGWYAIGQMFDAKHQLETQGLMQKMHAEAFKDYHPGEQLCRIGTAVRSLAPVEGSVRPVHISISENLNATYANREGTAAEHGAEQYSNSRLEQYKADYCVKTDANDELGLLCGDNADPGFDANGDIDFTRTFDYPMSVDYYGDDAANIMALAKNLYWSQAQSNVNDIEGDNKPSDYLSMRRIAAMKNIAHNSFAAIMAMKNEAPEPEGEVKPGWTFMKSLMREFGMEDLEIETLYGERPSYYAQMDILTKRMFQHPRFYTDLYDKPANVERLSASLEAIKSMQMRDHFQSSLRREMLISALLEETLVRRAQQQNADMFDTQYNDTPP